MSADFSAGYGSIRDRPGGNQGDRGTSGGYQSEDYILFWSLSDTISGNVIQINSNVAGLERIYKQLGNQLDDVPFEKIDCIELGTNKLVSDTTVCLKRMVNLQGGTFAERRRQRLQQDRLKEDFENSFSKYRNIQKKLATKSKQFMNSTAVKFTSHKGQHGSKNGEHKDPLLAEEQQSQQQHMEDSVSFDQNLLEEREKMMQQLESDVLDVNEIFRDLASIVHDQGEVIDSIEGHVFGAHSDVENARRELQKAEVYRKKARKKKCCFLAIVLVILTVVAVIIYIEAK